MWDLRDAWHFRWVDWFDDKTYKDLSTSRRDLCGIVHHEQLRDRLLGSIPVRLIAGDNLDRILATPALRELCRKGLDQFVAGRDRLTGFEPEWNQFTYTVTVTPDRPRVVDINAEAVEKLFSIDPVAELQARLRNGVVEELTWPAVEQSMSRLLADASQEAAAVEFFETYPAVAIRLGEKIEIIDGDQVIARGTVPAGVSIDAIYQVGEHVATFYHQNYSNHYSCWSGEAPVLDKDLGSYRSFMDGCSIPTPEGRLAGCGMLSYPHQLKDYGGQVLGTGPYYRFARQAQIDDDAAIEPVGRGESIPGVDLTDLPMSPPPSTYRFLSRQSTIAPVQPTTHDSLCGTLNGQHISIVFRGPYDGKGHPSHIWTPLGSFTSKHSIMGGDPQAWWWGMASRRALPGPRFLRPGNRPACVQRHKNYQFPGLCVPTTAKRLSSAAPP